MLDSRTARGHSGCGRVPEEPVEHAVSKPSTSIVRASTADACLIEKSDGSRSDGTLTASRKVGGHDVAGAEMSQSFDHQFAVGIACAAAPGPPAEAEACG